MAAESAAASLHESPMKTVTPTARLSGTSAAPSAQARIGKNGLPFSRNVPAWALSACVSPAACARTETPTVAIRQARTTWTKRGRRTARSYACHRSDTSLDRRRGLDDLDLDDVRRAGDVHGGAGGDDDPVAGLDDPALTRSVDRALPELLDVGTGLDRQRRDPPLQRHLLERVLVVREADDGPPGTEARDRGRGASREGRDEHRGRTERLGDVAGRVGHGLADGGLVLGLWCLVAVAEARLDGAADGVHRAHRLDRVLADRGLAGEHDRRGAVEHRVRDVGRLGAGRLR